MQRPNIPHPVDALVLAKIPQAVAERAATVRLMAFDVDGVLTDGRLWYGEQGEQLKCFHVLDGHGLRLLGECGITVALITGREGPILARRSAELGIPVLQQGVRDKAAALLQLANTMGLSMAEVGYMGDDIIDLPALQKAGLAVTVPDAPSYVAQVAHWVTGKPGGAGAARECCDLILASQGKLGQFLLPNTPLLHMGGELQ